MRGTLVECKVIGALDMLDCGKKDYKILAAPCAHIKQYNTVDDIDPMFLKVTKNFFKHYKDLENKIVEVGDWLNASEAMDIIKEDTI